MHPDLLMRHFALPCSLSYPLTYIQLCDMCIHYGAGSYVVNTKSNAYIKSANNGRDFGGHRLLKTEIFLFSRKFSYTEERSP